MSATREETLTAQVAALTAQHGRTPVAVNLQSGGNVAYATWLYDGRLYGYDLTPYGVPVLEWDLPATHLGVNGTVTPIWVEYADDVDPDSLPIDEGANLLTYWDAYDEYSPAEYRDGTFWMHNTATGLTHIYGVGAAL